MKYYIHIVSFQSKYMCPLLCMPCPHFCPDLNILFLNCFSLPRKHQQQQDKMDGFLRELQIPKDSPLTPLLSRIPRVRSSLVVVSCSTPCLTHLSHRRYTQPCSTFSHLSFLYTQPHPLCSLPTTSQGDVFCFRFSFMNCFAMTNMFA